MILMKCINSNATVCCCCCQEGASALYVTALRNHIEVLNALIVAGADVKLTDNV